MCVCVCVCVCVWGTGGGLHQRMGRQGAEGPRGARGLFYDGAPGRMPGILGVVVYLNPLFLNACLLFDLDTVIYAPSLAF